jgi:hypothetical protein
MLNQHPIRFATCPQFDLSRVETNKNVFSYWDGGKMSPLIDLCSQSIAFHHSNFMLVTKQDVVDLGWKWCLDETEGLRLPHRADLIRLLLLDRFGGMWVDTDMICFKSVDLIDLMSSLDVNLVVPVVKAKKKCIAVPLAIRANTADSKFAIAECKQLLRRKQLGEKQEWALTSSCLYLSMIESRPTAIAIDHWKYMRVWNRNYPALKSKTNKIEKFVGPNDMCFHLGGNKQPFKRDSHVQLLCSSRLISKMFRKAFGLAPLAGGRTHEIVDRLKSLNHPRFAEIGVYQGANALAILGSLPTSTAILVDAWKPATERYRQSGDLIPARHQTDNEWDGIYQGVLDALAEYNLSHRATVLRSNSIEASKTVSDSSLDLVFIDAEHSYEGCLEDIQAWFPKIKPGGWIGGHDYNIKRFSKWGVAKAVNHYFSMKSLDVTTGHDFTWWVRCPGEQSRTQ